MKCRMNGLGIGALGDSQGLRGQIDDPGTNDVGLGFPRGRGESGQVQRPGLRGCDETATAVDNPPASTVGDYPSSAIGIDGLQVISYYGGAAGTLKVAKCGNPTCE